MDKDTTRSLSKKLEKVRNAADAEAFVDAHAGTGVKDLHTFLNTLIAEKGIAVTDLIEKSGINKNYIYNILNGERKNPGRDKVIALCIGIGAGFSATNQALELVRHAPLYPKDERDIRIAVAINSGVGSVTKVNMMLEENGLAPLDI